jgi:cyclic pyranopterin phosphate synthase
MRDAFGREISYMRVSITDRCNLRCAYCMPEGFAPTSHADVLRYEEILRICAIAATTGIKVIKVTGGEPLARRGCVEFIGALKQVPGIERVTLTTNGVSLAPHVKALADMRLDGLNISLDALDPKIYQMITGFDAFGAVWRSLTAAIEAGLRVKLNCVPIRGVNEREILPLAALAEKLPVDVRFIELMPTRETTAIKGVPAAEVFDLLTSAYPDLTPDASERGFGPARYYKSDKLKGGVGLIAAFGSHFCAGCNRLRLTSEGFLKLCLYHDDGLDLRSMMRQGAGDAEIEGAMINTIQKKPERHYFGEKACIKGGIEAMPRIGG